MSNLRTILKDLVENIQGGDLTAYSKEMIEDTEQKIKELIPSKDDLAIEILVAIRGCGCETAKLLWTEKYYKTEHREIADRSSIAIHSAMLKKLED